MKFQGVYGGEGVRHGHFCTSNNCLKTNTYKIFVQQNVQQFVQHRLLNSNAARWLKPDGAQRIVAGDSKPAITIHRDPQTATIHGEIAADDRNDIS